jgi:prepilin signal peptidase PulO-like enzyme (type II secretory pathway)
MIAFLLFILGLAVGSFLNVVSLRYDPNSNRSIFSLAPIGGRSKCPSCAVTLRWYDLIPVLSFIMIRHKCRSCGIKISWQYPIVEIIAGFIALLPFYFYTGTISSLILGLIWTAVFYIFLLITIVDFHHYLIPDELNLAIAVLGIAKIGASPFASFLGGYGQIFGLRENLFINYFAAALFGLLFFGTIILATRGRGMGMGDLKMAGALGLLLGWPDIILAILLSFIWGSIYSIFKMAFSGLKLKDAVPFGPFIVLGVITTIFFGADILRLYFTVFVV